MFGRVFFSLYGTTPATLDSVAATPCTYVNILGDIVDATTMRSLCYGDEYYGTFFRSLFTLFQVLTGESWSEVVARPVIFHEGAFNIVGGIFFVFYIIYVVYEVLATYEVIPPLCIGSVCI